MRKIILVFVLILIMITGCYYWPPVKQVKKYGLENCDNLTFEQSINKYLKDTTWGREDKNTYIVKGMGMYEGNEENIEILFKLNNKEIIIEKYYVNNFNRLEKADQYLYSKLCPNRIENTVEQNDKEITIEDIIDEEISDIEE